jgi:hypothetical protein
MEHWRVRLRGVAHAAGPPGAVTLDLALAVSVDVVCVAA